MPWYADYINYLVNFVCPPEYSSHENKKSFSDPKHYFWDDLFQYRRGPNQIIRCCVPKEEQNHLWEHCTLHHTEVTL